MRTNWKCLRRVNHGRGVSSYLYRVVTADGVRYGYEIGDDGMHGWQGVDAVICGYAEALAAFRAALVSYCAVHTGRVSQ